MKVTQEMVGKAATAYEESAERQGLSTGDGVFFTAMLSALETVLDSYEREHSRWERFSLPEIKVLAAAVSTLDANGGTTEVAEYAQRLVNETRAVLRNKGIPKANRWDAFNDEELGEINAGASERADKLSLPEEIRLRAVRISYETALELRRRKGGYQGPGVYLYLDQTETTVLGIVKPDEGEEMVIFEQFVDVGVRGWELLSEFNRNGPRGEWLRPRYRYLRPLGEN